MKYVEWPGYPGQLFDPADVSACRTVPPDIHSADTGTYTDAEVILRSGVRILVGRNYAEVTERNVRLFEERVDDELSARRCSECVRILTGHDLQAAQCDSAGRLTCSVCWRAGLARVQATVQRAASGDNA